MITSDNHPFDEAFLSRLENRLNELKHSDATPLRMTTHDVNTQNAFVMALGGDIGSTFAQAIEVVNTAIRDGFITVENDTVRRGRRFGDLPSAGNITLTPKASTYLCSLGETLWLLGGIIAVLALLAAVVFLFGAVFSGGPISPALSGTIASLVIAIVGGLLMIGGRVMIKQFCAPEGFPVLIAWSEGEPPRFVTDSGWAI